MQCIEPDADDHAHPMPFISHSPRWKLLSISTEHVKSILLVFS